MCACARASTNSSPVNTRRHASSTSARCRCTTPTGRVAEIVYQDTEAMLAWYRDRQRRAKWGRPWVNRLEPYEHRLMEFLATTVEPCTHLVLAAAMSERDRDHVGPAREHVDAVVK